MLGTAMRAPLGVCLCGVVVLLASLLYDVRTAWPAGPVAGSRPRWLSPLFYAGDLVAECRLCDWPNRPSHIFVSSFTDGPLDDRLRSPDRADVDVAGRNLRVLCL